MAAECSELIWTQIPFKATPHKARLMTLYVINLYIFRHLAQKFLAMRQYACKISVQSDKKSNLYIYLYPFCVEDEIISLSVLGV